MKKLLLKLLIFIALVTAIVYLPYLVELSIIQIYPIHFIGVDMKTISIMDVWMFGAMDITLILLLGWLFKIIVDKIYLDITK